MTDHLHTTRKECGVYEIVNTINKKRYVGSSVNIKRRWQTHKSKLRKGIHENEHLQRAWNKYGENCFEFHILRTTERGEHLRLENELLATGNYEYNIGTKVGAAMLGRNHTEETKRKISALHSGENHPMYGKHLPKITRDKISASNKGKRRSEKSRKRLSESKSGKNHPLYGKHLSESHRKKLSIAHSGNNAYQWISFTDDELKQMNEMRNNGLTYENIAETFNVSRQTVTRRMESTKDRRTDYGHPGS